MGKRKYYLVLIALILLGFLAIADGRSLKTRDSLTIYAAAGTRLAAEAVCDNYESQNQISIIRNYASSGTLARQIASGAQCDIYISANKQWIDFLVKKQLLVTGSVKKIAGNSLVLIAPQGKQVTIPQFNREFNILELAPEMIAMGDPAYVPVGRYAKQVFDDLGWADKLSGKIVFAKDVSSVLHYVELGECEWGVVYRSEAVNSKKVKIVAQIPESLHKRISFYIATIKDSNVKAQCLVEFFKSPGSLKVFLDQGFEKIGG